VHTIFFLRGDQNIFIHKTNYYYKLFVDIGPFTQKTSVPFHQSILPPIPINEIF